MLSKRKTIVIQFALLFVVFCMAVPLQAQQTSLNPSVSEADTLTLYVRGEAITAAQAVEAGVYPNAMTFNFFIVHYIEDGAYFEKEILIGNWLKREYKDVPQPGFVIGGMYKVKVVKKSIMDAKDRTFTESQTFDTTGEYDAEPYWLLSSETIEEYDPKNKIQSNRVILGRDGWIYDALTLRERPLAARALAQMKDELTTIRDWLAERDVKMLLLVVPSKISVYPEFADPETVAKLNKDGRRVDQFMKFINEETDLDVLYLLDALREAKATSQERYGQTLYYKTDTHWTYYGAYEAYSYLVGYLSKYYDNIGPAPIKSYNYLPNIIHGINTPFIGLHGILEEASFGYTSLKPEIEAEYNEERPNRPRLLMAENSFGNFLRRFFQPSFSPVDALYTRSVIFNDKLIEHYKPNIVILQQSEVSIIRFLDHVPPKIEEQ
jgi:hypothetical protein